MHEPSLRPADFPEIASNAVRPGEAAESPVLRRRAYLLPALVLSPGVFAAALWLSLLLLRHLPTEIMVPWAVVTLLGCAGGLILLGGLWHLTFRWWRPLYQLSHTLELIQKGQAPIEELSHVKGALNLLAPPIQQILRDGRSQRAQIVALEEEMRQRIAGRTDALERTIGSLRQQATRDPLTGLFNRRMLEQHLPGMIEAHRNDRRPLCLVMMDLDFFKVLNDVLGHAAGDEMLRTTAQLIRSTIRDSDWAFRCGGDEFLAVLPDCPRESAEALAGRLVSLVDAAGRSLHVTPAPRLSAGIVMLDEVPGADAVTLLREADRRLYTVKSAHHAQERSARAAG